MADLRSSQRELVSFEKIQNFATKGTGKDGAMTNFKEGEPAGSRWAEGSSHAPRLSGFSLTQMCSYRKKYTGGTYV